MSSLEAKIVQSMLLLREIMPDDPDVKKVVDTYEHIKKECEKDEGFKKGVEMYMFWCAANIKERREKKDLDPALAKIIGGLK